MTDQDEFKITTGIVYWDESATEVLEVDNPKPPSNKPKWVLVAQSLSEIRFSKQVIFWTWHRIKQFGE